jgi:four helix bundle protein
MGNEVKSHEDLRIWQGASGSLTELETQLYLSGELGYADKELISELKKEIILLRKQIYATIRSLSKK